MPPPQDSTNVRFVEADVQSYRFDPAYDFCFSRFGMMFFANPVLAMRNVKSALKPGGELMFITWRALDDNPFLGMPKAVVSRFLPPPGDDAQTCGPGPFSMANPDIVGAQLKAAGFMDFSFERIDGPVMIGSDVEQAVAFQLALGPAAEIFREAGALAEARSGEIEAALRTELGALCARGRRVDELQLVDDPRAQPGLIVVELPALPRRPHRHHRRRRHRLQHRLSPGQARRARRRAAGAPAAHARRDLARGRTGRAAAQQQQSDAPDALFAPSCTASSRRKPARPPAGTASGSLRLASSPARWQELQALGDDGQGLRLPRRAHLRRAGARAVSAARDRPASSARHGSTATATSIPTSLTNAYAAGARAGGVHDRAGRPRDRRSRSAAGASRGRHRSRRRSTRNA